MAGTAASPSKAPHAQTLDRGLRALELLADSDEALSLAEVSSRLGLHRSVTYRVLRTLEDHRLLERDDRGRFGPGLGLSVLAGSVRRTLQSAALPELTVLANDLGMTAFLVVRDGDDAVTLVSVEPRHSIAHVAYRPGTRHPVHRGAPGLALLAGEAPQDGERRDVTAARADGWVTTAGEVLTGMRSVAVPVHGRSGRLVGALCVVFVDVQADLAPVGARVGTAASALGAELP
ncbi:MAG: IclR family transcriptional regulator [Actinomycetes bacterium]